MSGRRRPGPLPRGTALLSALALAGLLAPCLAGSRPIVSIGAGGALRLPALGEILRIWPESGVPAAGDDSWSLYPPVRHDPLAIDLASRLNPPGRAHWLGTDDLGRDTLSRLIHATRPSLLVALIATAISLALGIPIGAAAGFGGRRIDLILSRLIEASAAFPSIVLLLFATSLLLGETQGAGGSGGGPGAASLLAVGVAVGMVRWAVIARYMRAEVMRAAGSEMCESARAAGAGPGRILARHLIPAGIAPVTVSAAFGAGSAVIAEASLSFLGMGVQPPAPTWGQMIATAASSGGGSWWLLIFPGMMVALLVAGCHMVGEGLRARTGRPSV